MDDLRKRKDLLTYIKKMRRNGLKAGSQSERVVIRDSPG